MAKAIRKTTKRAISPEEAMAKYAEELASDRFDLSLDGRDYVTEVNGEPAVDVAKMYRVLLAP